MRAILVRPGYDPEICKIPEETSMQLEVISELLDGNIGSTEFFDLGNGVSLFVLVNDFSVPLGLVPNRRFPGKDKAEIIFGNAVFIAAYNDRAALEGTIDMPERICHMFIEQIKLNFAMCKGDEKPSERAQIYVENQGTAEERKFKWIEIEKPANVGNFIKAGRANLLQNTDGEYIEINGRYFRQMNISEKGKMSRGTWN